MFIVYKKGEIRNQIIAWGADKERRLEGGCFGIFQIPANFLFRFKELEAVLIMTGAVHPPEGPRPQNRRTNDDDDSEEDEDDPSSRMRSAATSTNGRPKKNIRDRNKGNDSDSDFDFDL
jgi:hypothetical protein